jgi:predicted short-subunit dehydrogenase-like oxidoreductase (DUF2520 family)
LASRCRNAAAICVFRDKQSLSDACDLVFITVPDDTIREVVNEINWHEGQQVVHCSAATEVSALAKAAADGASTGGFHPLQLFSDPEVASQHLRGSTVAIEAQGTLKNTLIRLAHLLGMNPIELPAGSRSAYHVAGNLAASCLLAVLKEAEEIWAQCGLPQDQALPSLMPLCLGTLAAANQSGIAQAVAGPVSRGDLEVVNRHLHTLTEQGRDTLFYQELLFRLSKMAKSTGRINDETAQQLALILRSRRPAGEPQTPQT